MTTVEHRYDPAIKKCVCGETRTVSIVIDDKPYTCEHHSSPASIAAMVGRDACYHLFKDTGPKSWEHPELSFTDLVLMLEDGDTFYFVPSAY